MDKQLARTGMMNSAMLSVFFLLTTIQSIGSGSVFWSLLGFSATAFSALDVYRFYKG